MRRWLYRRRLCGVYGRLSSAQRAVCALWSRGIGWPRTHFAHRTGVARRAGRRGRCAAACSPRITRPWNPVASVHRTGRCEWRTEFVAHSHWRCSILHLRTSELSYALHATAAGAQAVLLPLSLVLTPFFCLCAALLRSMCSTLSVAAHATPHCTADQWALS